MKAGAGAGAGTTGAGSPSQPNWMLFSSSAKASVYSSQSSGRAVDSCAHSTVPPSGSGTKAWTAEVTTQRRCPSAASGPGTGTVRPSTRTAAGPAGSRTVHTSACRRTVASSVASAVIGSG